MSEAQKFELAVSGMTCGSCAAKVAAALNRLAHNATVNYATGIAQVSASPEVPLADFISAVERTGYTATVVTEDDPDAPHDDPLAPRRMALALTLAGAVLVLGMASAPGWILGLLTGISFIVAWPIHRAALAAARHRTTTMDTLISLGVSAALGWSIVAELAGQDQYFEVAAVVPAIVLLGRHLEARARHRSGSALAELAGPIPEKVELAMGAGATIEVAELTVGQEFWARSGDRIATDGEVIRGESLVDNSLLTGESRAVAVEPGSSVLGGSVLIDGELVIRATSVGSHTTVAQLRALVRAAQTGQAPIQRLADRISRYFVPAIIAIALLTGMGWLISGADFGRALAIAISVLIIACPCALGLAIPTAMLVATGRGAQLGILLRGPQILESTRRITTMVFDKTGTLTSGSPTISLVETVPGVTTEELIGAAAAAERGSRHPLARAIKSAYAGPDLAAEGFRAEIGLGVHALVELPAGTTPVRVGRAEFIGAEIPPALAASGRRARAAGQSVVFVAWSGRVQGLIAIHDPLRPQALGVVQKLTEMGIRPRLLSGDAAEVAHQVGDRLNLPSADITAEVLPAGKLDHIRDLQAQSEVVAFIGDGVNDAAALAAANVGLAMGGGTQVAKSASAIVLMRSELAAAVDAIELAQRTLRIMYANLFWAFGYNVAAIPLAAAGQLTPIVAGAAMGASSLFVVVNSLRLQRFSPSRFSA
ncbi:MAG: heavy metal translocating P-type ATPase [Angustibacter sp.]